MPSRNAGKVEAEYQRFKRFVLAFAEFLDARRAVDSEPSFTGEPGPDGEIVYREFHGPHLPFAPSLRQAIARLEETKPSAWRSGIRQAVQDLLEMSRDLTPADVQGADVALAAAGAPSLSIIRSEVWRTIPKLLKRGRIQIDSEYYLLIERLNDTSEGSLTPEERDRLAAMIAEFEERRARRG